MHETMLLLLALVGDTAAAAGRFIPFARRHRMTKMMSTIRRNLPLTRRRSAIAQINTIIARRILLHSATTTTDTDTRQQRRFPSAPPHTSAHRSKFILFSSANNKTTLSLFGAASESSCFCFYLRHTTSLLRSTEKPEYVGCFDCSGLAAPPTRKLISKMTQKKNHHVGIGPAVRDPFPFPFPTRY